MKNTHPASHKVSSTEKSRVIGYAFYNAARRLKLETKDIEKILGVSQATISRHKQSLEHRKSIELGAKPEQHALMLLRIFRSLDTLFGGDENRMRAWFDSENFYLRGKPRELIHHIEGVVHVAEYLDAMRGKI